MASTSSALRNAARALAQAQRTNAVQAQAQARARAAAAGAGAATTQRGLATTGAVARQQPPPPQQDQPQAPVDPNARPDTPTSATPLSPSPPPPKAHSSFTVGLVKMAARLLGYNSTTSMAIRVTSELYDACAAQADEQADFWYGTCQLPRTYQTWFQITTMHVHLLLTRFRALDTADKANAYSQELINHFFIDAESRMRMRFGVQTSRLVKGYMREMHTQQRGAILGLDEALSFSVARDTDRERYGDADAALATALWRNLWGAGGWGRGVAGVKRKLKGIDRDGASDKKAREAAEKAGTAFADDEGKPELAQDLGPVTAGRGEQGVADAALAARKKRAEAAGDPVALESLEHDDQTPGSDLQFAVALQRLVAYYRRETVRLASLGNGDIEKGRVGRMSGTNMQQRLDELKQQPRVGDFSRA